MLQNEKYNESNSFIIFNMVIYHNLKSSNPGRESIIQNNDFSDINSSDKSCSLRING